ncbi:YetF domain-containing protein [Chryseobacterium sp.]|uniref:YetF domain-containing protein n=1 Tax=Chryseobacterium sp. TaxID=1871047 RepID=UPI0028969082|nr:YetF domain-containing protein [Chryseobacterium sp.]
MEIDWKELWMGSESWDFLLQIVFRTAVMFLTIIFGIRLLGKRGVKQLSIFELVVIIGLGSAAGDPMFYREVGLVSSITVFFVIIIIYSLVIYLIGKSKKIEILLEGKPVLLIENGVFAIDNFKKEKLGSDEFFAELRLKSVSHLGQIEMAIEETSGEISLFFYEDENVKYGLPVLLHSLDKSTKIFELENHYSCTFCGYTELKNKTSENTCKNCRKHHWIVSSNRKRIA